MTSLEILQPVDEAQDVADDVADDQAFTCPLDGRTFGTSGGYNRHVSRTHPDSLELKIVSSGATKGSRASTTKSDFSGAFDASKPKPKRIKSLKLSILNDFNPFMLTLIQQTGIPAELMEWTPIPGSPPLSKELVLNDFQADLVSRAIVELDGTPVAATIGRVMGPIVPYFFGLAGLLVVGMHVVKVFMLRKMVTDNMETFLQLMASQQQTEQNGNGTSPARNFA